MFVDVTTEEDALVAVVMRERCRSGVSLRDIYIHKPLQRLLLKLSLAVFEFLNLP